jgi:hypothetical protein
LQASYAKVYVPKGMNVRYVDEGLTLHNCEGINWPHCSSATFLHQVPTYTGISNTVHCVCVCMSVSVCVWVDVQMRMSMHVHVKFQITEI